MRINHQKKFLINYKNSLVKQYIIFIVIFLLTLFFLFLVATVNFNGWTNIDSVWRDNKRVIVAIFISSFSLGISSFLFQNLTKNKLADSSALGIGNINLVVLMLLIYLLDFNSSYAISNYKYVLPFAFIIFSILLSLGIYFLSYKKNRSFSKKFIISGIVLNFIFIAVSQSFNTFLPSGKAAIVRQYTNGFYDSSEDYYIYVSLFFFILAIIWVFLIMKKFQISSCNEEIAKSLGINVKNINFQILIIAGIFAGVSFILVGNVAFLGLVGGNMAIFLFKKNYKLGLPASGYISTILVALTFFLNKNIAQSNINTSQLIPLISMPYFLYLIYRSK